MRRWLAAAGCCNVLLQGIDASLLILCHVLPAVMNTSIILSLVIPGDLVPLLWDEEVGLGRRYIVRILHVVAWIVFAVYIWRVNWLLEFLKPLFVGPFGLVEVVLFLFFLN